MTRFRPGVEKKEFVLGESGIDWWIRQSTRRGLIILDYGKFWKKKWNETFFKTRKEKFLEFSEVPWELSRRAKKRDFFRAKEKWCWIKRIYLCHCMIKDQIYIIILLQCFSPFYSISKDTSTLRYFEFLAQKLRKYALLNDFYRVFKEIWPWGVYRDRSSIMAANQFLKLKERFSRRVKWKRRMSGDERWRNWGGKSKRWKGSAILRQKSSRKVDFEGLNLSLINKIRKGKIRSRLEIYFGQN